MPGDLGGDDLDLTFGTGDEPAYSNFIDRFAYGAIVERCHGSGLEDPLDQNMVWSCFAILGVNYRSGGIIQELDGRILRPERGLHLGKITKNIGVRVKDFRKVWSRQLRDPSFAICSTYDDQNRS